MLPTQVFLSQYQLDAKDSDGGPQILQQFSTDGSQRAESCKMPEPRSDRDRGVFTRDLIPRSPIGYSWKLGRNDCLAIMFFSLVLSRIAVGRV